MALSLMVPAPQSTLTPEVAVLPASSTPKEGLRSRRPPPWGSTNELEVAFTPSLSSLVPVLRSVGNAPVAWRPPRPPCSGRPHWYNVQSTAALAFHPAPLRAVFPVRLVA